MAAATRWITFVPKETYHESHFINEKYVPADFLALVSDALLDSYPSPETFAAADPATRAGLTSPAVVEVIVALKEVIGTAPAEFVDRLLDPVRAGLVRWLSDESRMANAELGQKVRGNHALVRTDG